MFNGLLKNRIKQLEKQLEEKDIIISDKNSIINFYIKTLAEQNELLARYKNRSDTSKVTASNINT